MGGHLGVFFPFLLTRGGGAINEIDQTTAGEGEEEGVKLYRT